MARFPNIPPSRTTRLQVSPPIKSHRFGDGHVRYLKLGVRPAEKEWALRWTNLPPDDAEQIERFLSNGNAASIFDWTPPRASRSQKYICTSWSIAPQPSGHADIDAVFAEHA